MGDAPIPNGGANNAVETNSEEKTEQGIVVAVKGDFGFLRYAYQWEPVPYAPITADLLPLWNH